MVLIINKVGKAGYFRKLNIQSFHIDKEKGNQFVA